MSYTTKLMNQFNVKRHQVGQEGSKQCAVVYLNDKMLFVSYNIVVGFNFLRKWYFTEEKHSCITSRQVTAFPVSKTYIPALIFDAAMSNNKLDGIELY